MCACALFDSSDAGRVSDRRNDARTRNERFHAQLAAAAGAPPHGRRVSTSVCLSVCLAVFNMRLAFRSAASFRNATVAQQWKRMGRLFQSLYRFREAVKGPHGRSRVVVQLCACAFGHLLALPVGHLLLYDPIVPAADPWPFVGWTIGLCLAAITAVFFVGFFSHHVPLVRLLFYSLVCGFIGAAIFAPIGQYWIGLAVACLFLFPGAAAGLTACAIFLARHISPNGRTITFMTMGFFVLGVPTLTTIGVHVATASFVEVPSASIWVAVVVVVSAVFVLFMHEQPFTRTIKEVSWLPVVACTALCCSSMARFPTQSGPRRSVSSPDSGVTVVFVWLAVLCFFAILFIELTDRVLMVILALAFWLAAVFSGPTIRPLALFQYGAANSHLRSLFLCATACSLISKMLRTKWHGLKLSCTLLALYPRCCVLLCLLLCCNSCICRGGRQYDYRIAVRGACYGQVRSSVSLGPRCAAAASAYLHRFHCTAMEASYPAVHFTVDAAF